MAGADATDGHAAFAPGDVVSRVRRPCRPGGHAAFWGEWNKRLDAAAPELRVARAIDRDPSDPGATHVFDSDRHVRIGCVLIEPPAGAALRGGVVSLHGYGEPSPLEDEPKRWRELSERGTAVLAIRIRGYPGSRLDVGAFSEIDGETGETWITRGLGSLPESPTTPTDWLLPQGIADVVLAVRAMRRWLMARGSAPRVAIRGESYGAGLAIIAASQLATSERVDRLCIGLPTFGDWAWRLETPHAGAGEELRRGVDRFGETREKYAAFVRSFDTLLHARRVCCPVLMKLALSDDVVPALTQGAVFNSLKTPSAEKWRFLVGVGHGDGGIADMRRHALFERASTDFLDFSRQETRAMAAWEPILSGGERPEQARSTTGGGLFGDGTGTPLSDHDALLIRAYEGGGRTLDDLPYTPEFDRVLGAVQAEAPAFGAREVFHRLQNLRKAGRLPRAGAGATKPPRVAPEEEAILSELVVERADSLGNRDRLPYTREFDGLIAAFNERTGHELSPHSVWRLVAKLAK